MTIKLNMEMPTSCKNCPFRQNRTRESWKCALRKGYREGSMYISTVYKRADQERPDFCPLGENLLTTSQI